MSARRRLPWYAEGLRFSCSECGDCCSGEPGAVWLNAAERAALAAHLGLSEHRFTQRYLRELDGRWALRERVSGDCIFLHEGNHKCEVYSARPVQCRTWPFWPQNVGRRESWQRTCEACPGAGQGKHHTLDAIEQQLAEVMAARRVQR